MCEFPGCRQTATKQIPMPGNQNPFKVCDQHATAQRKRCRGCNFMVAIATTTVVGHDADDRDPTYCVCKFCIALEPVACDGCPHFLTTKDGSKQLRDEVDIEGTVGLCAPCAANADTFCGACGAVTTVEGDDGRILLTGARAVKDADRTVGWRCKMCAVGAITDLATAQPHYTAAVRWMQAWLQRNGAADAQFGDKLTCELVLDGTIGHGGKHARAVCRPVQGEPGHHKILVLNQMRPVAFQGEVVHELTHAWANNAKVGDARLIEGFCNYVAGQFLQATYPGNDEAGRAVARMENDRDPLYGANFVMVRGALRDTPDQAVAWFKRQQ